ASGTYSLPSAFMKSYWVSTSQKMTRGIPGSLPHNGPGNFSEETGQCQQERQQLDLQPQHHCYLITAILPRAPRAVGPHLEGKMPLFGEHEAELVEERGLARQRQHFGDSAGPCLGHQGVHQGPAHAGALLIRPHRQPGPPCRKVPLPAPCSPKIGSALTPGSPRGSSSRDPAPPTR